MITVYWGVPELSNFTGIRHEAPVPLLSHHLKGKDLQALEYNKCPGFRKSIENTFCGTASLPFSMSFQGQGFTFDPSQQQLFERLVVIRSIQERMFSWNMRHLFFTDEDSLLMDLMHPWLEDNEFTNNVSLVSGQFDIGKWFRPAESSFTVKKGDRTVSIKEGDPLYYLKFHTTEKIQFKRFMCTPEIYSFVNSTVQSRNYHTHDANSLDWYYKIFGKHKKFKSLILKKIKENLID